MGDVLTWRIKDQKTMGSGKYCGNQEYIIWTGSVLHACVACVNAIPTTGEIEEERRRKEREKKEGT